MSEFAMIQLAEELHREFVALDRDYGLNFARRAVILQRIQNDELWAYLTRPDGKPYRSFNQYLECAATYSERDCRYALSAIKELKDIPESDFKQMPRESIEVMKLIPESLREDYIEPAKTLKPDQFFRKVDQEHPNLHLERRKPVTIKPDDVQSDTIQQALRMAQLKGATSKTEAYEKMADAALKWWQLEERLHGRESSFDIGRGDLAQASEGVPEPFWASPDRSKLPN